MLAEESLQTAIALACAEVVEELAYLLLEQNDERQHTHRHQFVEDAAQQTHLQHLAYEEPHHDEHHDADEDVQGARGTHESENIVQHQCDKYDVDDVFWRDIYEHLVALFNVISKFACKNTKYFTNILLFIRFFGNFAQCLEKRHAISSPSADKNTLCQHRW